MDMSKIAALAAQAVAKGVDMTQATQGGGDYTPPPEGWANLRFISYIECGKHEKVTKGVKKTTERVMLTFELSGKLYPVNENGEPARITIEENLSLNDKANFYKLFTRMNYAGKAKHMAELLGEAFRGRVCHDKWAGKDGKERITAQLRDKETGYTIVPPRVEVPKMDDEGAPTGEVEVRNVTVAPAISPLKCFLWNFADMEQWAGLFIEGEYPERKNDKGEVTAPAKSKNVLQNKIKLAKNFTGSVMHTLLVAKGGPIDIPDAEDGNDPDAPESFDDVPDAPTGPVTQATPSGVAADDALAGIVG